MVLLADGFSINIRFSGKKYTASLMREQTLIKACDMGLREFMNKLSTIYIEAMVLLDQLNQTKDIGKEEMKINTTTQNNGSRISPTYSVVKEMEYFSTTPIETAQTTSPMGSALPIETASLSGTTQPIVMQHPSTQPDLFTAFCHAKDLFPSVAYHNSVYQTQQQPLHNYTTESYQQPHRHLPQTIRILPSAKPHRTKPRYYTQHQQPQQHLLSMPYQQHQHQSYDQHQQPLLIYQPHHSQLYTKK
jgi:hypothetical protein